MVCRSDIGSIYLGLDPAHDIVTQIREKGIPANERCGSLSSRPDPYAFAPEALRMDIENDKQVL